MSDSEAPRPSRFPASARTNGRRGLRSAVVRVLGRKSVWLAVTGVLVLGGVLGSLLAAQAVSRSEAEKAKLAFHLNSAEIASTLKLAIQHEEDLVVSANAFASAPPRPTATSVDRWAESVHALQRYPELQDIGLVALVQASRLVRFKAEMAANPLRPLGPNSVGPREPFQIVPAGRRPYYCLAVAGRARSMASYLPKGLDYCSLAPTLVSARDTGLPSYAPFINGATTSLGIEIPVYQGGVTPSSVAARRHAFLGWIGELLVPGVVLRRALEGHPGFAVTFTYSSSSSHVVFNSANRPARAQMATVELHNGWTVQAYARASPVGVLANPRALTLLVGGTLLSLVFGLLLVVLGTGRLRALSLVRQKTRELSYLALHDALTGLPNRALVLDRAEQLLARAARRPGALVGALYIDIDGFKHVNDDLGHAAGDQLLRVLGERLALAVRDQDTVGRLGGDEFVVLVESVIDEHHIDVLADRLTEVLREPVELDDGRKIFSVTASAGVAVGRYSSSDALLRDADLALYSAKAAGKDRYALFEASMYQHAEGRAELEADLSLAVSEQQFFLHYQPIFDLPNHRVATVEALIRWKHPSRGTVAPDTFIPLAEESGMIIPIGRWVLEEACRQAAAWAAEGLAVGISVNVSAHQLARKGFAEDVERAVKGSGVPPSSLTLEVTETVLMRDVSAARERLTEIKALGVHVAIDDFGTGYASLSQLQRLPVDILKIDRSFVAALNDGGQSRELLAAILGVGQALSLAVVAEGIEEPSQLRTLEEMGCHLAQGYLLGRPGPAGSIEALHAAGGEPRVLGQLPL